MWTAAIGLSILLAALAWRYAHIHPRHRPTAAFITAILAVNIARRVLALANAPAYAAAHGAPLTGWARANFHLDELLQLAWPSGLAGVAALVLLEEPHRRRAAAAAGGAWGLAALGLALAYPGVRGAVLGRCYLAAELVAVAAVVACGVSWWQRRLRPSLIEGSVLVLCAVELGAVVQWAPFGPMGRVWQLTTYFIGYGALAVLHGGELCSS